MTYDIVERARRRTRLALLGAGVVAVLLIAGFVTVLSLAGGGGSEQPPPPVARPTVNEPILAPPQTPGSGPSGAEATTADDDITWSSALGFKDLPRSKKSGPKVLDARTARGFAHDELGAVLAAVHITARSAPEAGSATFGPTIEDQVEGLHRVVLRNAVTAAYAKQAKDLGIRGGAPLIEQSSTLVIGYLVKSYTPDRAEVALVLDGYNGTTASWQRFTSDVSLVWQRDDWRMVAPRLGRMLFATGAPSSFTRFPPPAISEEP